MGRILIRLFILGHFGDGVLVAIILETISISGNNRKPGRKKLTSK
jgi:hypothetical protein